MDVLTFASDPIFYEMEFSGEKPFTVRCWDFNDERCRRLYHWHFIKHEKLGIRIQHTKTKDEFVRELRGVEFMRRCPHWVIIYLGDVIEPEAVEEEGQKKLPLGK